MKARERPWKTRMHRRGFSSRWEAGSPLPHLQLPLANSISRSSVTNDFRTENTRRRVRAAGVYPTDLLREHDSLLHGNYINAREVRAHQSQLEQRPLRIWVRRAARRLGDIEVVVVSEHDVVAH